MSHSTSRAGKVNWYLLAACVAGGFIAGGLIFSFTGISNWFSSKSVSARSDEGGSGSAKNRTATRVVALARLEPEGGIINLAGPPGDRIRQVKSQLGQQVKQGDPLIELESYQDRKNQVELLEIKIKEATKQRDTIETSYKAQMAELDAKENQLKTLTPLDIEQQTANLNLLREKESAMQKQQERLNSLVQAPISEQEKEQQALLAKQSSEDVKIADLLLKKTRLTADENAKLIDSQKKSAQASRDRALGELSLDLLNKQLEEAKDQMQRAVIKAPSNGAVLRLLAHEGEATTGQPVLQMADTSKMVAVAEVFESDAAQLMNWQAQNKTIAATVESQVFPAEKLTGKVTHIGQMIARNQLQSLNPGDDNNRRVVEVRIALDSSNTASHFLNLQVTATLEPK
jgi:HlyD family secretion protein